MTLELVEDTDLNWVQNRSEEFTARALGVFRRYGRYAPSPSVPVYLGPIQRTWQGT